MTPEQIRAIDAALAAGRKIQAIKLCREASGTGLKEAKTWVEQREVALKATAGLNAEIQGVAAAPTPAPSPFESKSGCLGALVLLFFAARH